jgi:leucyl aminopeptidase
VTSTSWTTITTVAGTAADLQGVCTATLALAAGEGEGLTAGPGARDSLTGALRAVGWQAKPGQRLDWIGNGGERFLVLGHDDKRDGLEWASLGGHLVEAMRTLRIEAVRLPDSGEIGAEALEGLVLGALLHGFKLDQGRQKPAEGELALRLIVRDEDQLLADRAIRIATPINRARAWTEQPANLLVPSVFALEASEALAGCGANVRVIDRSELEAMGAGGVLAVGQGSRNEPCMLVAEWRGAPDREGWDAVLVGKGITFDSGGLNLKTAPIIVKMKLDMGGAAAVLGAFEQAATRKAKANIAVVVPMAENSIGSNGYRPGDVIRMLSGQTAEIQNTDAEGRLVVADGVTYGIREYDPRHIVDVATLTGMITGVLHEEYAGLYASDDTLAKALGDAGERVGEALWRMPLTSRQDYLVDSTVADVSNLGAPGLFGVGSGSPAAGAKFIERFAKGRSWAHIDIAGTAWITRRGQRSGPGATGFGVALLDRWIATLEGSDG